MGKSTTQPEPGTGPTRPIVLVGMMGAGKSRIGQMLARKLQLPFHDSDALIEAREKLTIPEIFRQRGEPHFRAVEAAVISELLDRPPGVFSTGGGAVLNETTRQKLLEKSFVIYLEATPETLFQRVRKDTNRPLLQEGNPLERLRELLQARNSFYHMAHCTVKTDGLAHDRVLEQILALLPFSRS
jgi:shikimate kinase